MKFGRDSGEEVRSHTAFDAHAIIIAIRRRQRRRGGGGGGGAWIDGTLKCGNVVFGGVWIHHHNTTPY